MKEKIFKLTLIYLKASAIMGTLACLSSLYFVGIDPWHSLDGLIWTDLYGTPELPAAAKPAFTLAFLLFSWLSALTLIMVFLITHFALARREKWAYWAIVLMGVFWPLGGALITCHTGAWSYFISVAMMAMLFLPPVVILFPHFRRRAG